MIAVDNPTIALELLRGALAKDRPLRGRPARLPIQRVKFDMRQAKPRRELARQGSLSRAADADHGDAAGERRWGGEYIHRVIQRSSSLDLPYGARTLHGTAPGDSLLV